MFDGSDSAATLASALPRVRERALPWLCERLLAPADVRLNGSRPWDIQVHDRRALRHALLRGSLGFGEGYVEGWWSARDLEELAYRLALAEVDEAARLLPYDLLATLDSLLRNRQTRARARSVVERHYDFGNDLFSAFLGKYKNYSCGYFADTPDLDRAQLAKLELICRKLCLKPGERLLDVGGGFGEFARHAAQNYGVRVTSINLSEAQMQYARERVRGLDVKVVRADYRDVQGQFDKIAAIAMFTHVGYRNYRAFMRNMQRLLVPGGVMLLEGVWGNRSLTRIDAWIDRHIFPNAVIPSGAQTFAAFEGLFVAEDLHNFGPSYVHTLRAWHQNLERAWPELSARYPESVRRTFEFFFLLIAGFFRARVLHNWHLVLSRSAPSQPACRIR